MNDALAMKIGFALSLLIVATLAAYSVAESRPMLWIAILAAAASAGINGRAVLPKK